MPAVAEAQTVRGVTDKEVSISTYTDLSGVTAMWGVNNMNTWCMVFEEANAAGGVHGRKIKHVIEDSQYQVPRAVQASNKLLNRDNVFMMVADGGTPMNNARMPEQLSKQVPNMFPLTAARSMYAPLHPLKFGLAASYYDMMRAGVKLFVEERGKKVLCSMSQDTDFGRDVMDGAHEQVKIRPLGAGVRQTLPLLTSASGRFSRPDTAPSDAPESRPGPIPGLWRFAAGR